jgi:hypothetical protein
LKYHSGIDLAYKKSVLKFILHQEENRMMRKQTGVLVGILLSIGLMLVGRLRLLMRA